MTRPRLKVSVRVEVEGGDDSSRADLVNGLARWLDLEGEPDRFVLEETAAAIEEEGTGWVLSWLEEVGA